MQRIGESDTDLVNRAIEGDGDAFDGLFNRYYAMIYAFSYRVCLDKGDAEDAAQETFIKAARALRTFHGKEFKAWIYRIALNACRDTNRRLGRKLRLEESVALEMKAGGRPAEYPEIFDALEKLPVEMRETVALVFMEGMNHAEAAGVLGCAETTVSWRLFRAKRKLKDLLEAKG